MGLGWNECNGDGGGGAERFVQIFLTPPPELATAVDETAWL